MRDVGALIHQLMDENYRLFFNIKPLQSEVTEEQVGAKGISEGKETENVEYEDELGGENEVEDKVLEEGQLGETEPDEEESNVEGKALTLKTEELVDAKGSKSVKVWHGTQRAAVTISVLSAFRPSAQLSVPDTIQYEPEACAKSDSEPMPELALLLQLLQQAERDESQDGIHSEVCTVLDCHIIF
jgi:hypothetical protein